jgi:glycosyltransferase involved in cell wall biosynthesis
MRKNAPKVSIIVPIYNVEKYLRQCLDSIVGQTLADLEIILINDGSKDGSPDIMREYAARDRRVKIIDKPNEGYGRTMNRGIDAARGEYVGIVESDDWADPDMFEALYSLAARHDADVVKSNHFQFADAGGEKSKKIRMLPENDIGRVINPKERSDIFYCQPCIWSAIYKRDFLNKRKIRFLESPGASYQDTGFNFKVWAMADRVWLTSDAFLHYRQHPSQSVSSTGKVFCVCDEWDEVERFMNDYPEWKKSSAKLRNQVKLGSYRWNLNRLAGADKEIFRKRFAAEYKNAIRKNEVDREYFGSMREWVRFRQVLEPKSVRLKIARILLGVGRLFVKSRILWNKRRWYVLGGFFEVWQSPINNIRFLYRDKNK